MNRKPIIISLSGFKLTKKEERRWYVKYVTPVWAMDTEGSGKILQNVRR